MKSNVWHSPTSRKVGRIGLGLVLTLLMGLPPIAQGASRRHVVVVCIDGFAAYLLDDPKAPVPTLRKLAKEGAVAEGGMRVSNPSVTWPITLRLFRASDPKSTACLPMDFWSVGRLEFPCTSSLRRTRKTWYACRRF